MARALSSERKNGGFTAQMKRRSPKRRARSFVIILAALAICAITVREVQPSLFGPLAPPPDVWTPHVWEEFDALDLDRWELLDRTQRDNEDSYLLASNVAVESGVLRIQARLEGAGGRAYTSGSMQGRGFRLPDHFRVELRARVPFEQGMWAAPLWLRPVDHSGGEIDLVETYGMDAEDPVLRQTIHTDYGDDHEKAVSRTRFDELGDKSATDWHTYRLEKTPGRLVMWVDGIKTAEYTSTDPAWYDEYYEAGKAWEARINLQVGGGFGGLPNETTDWSPASTALEVDYLRTWTPSWRGLFDECGRSRSGCVPLRSW